MYVAVKGGAAAIAAAEELLAATRRGDPAVPELSPAQIREQLGLAVDRVMAEAALYDRDLAALALKQAQGDTIEAVFLLRAYRTTLPRLAASLPVDTRTLRPRRRISACFKDIPGGQILGPTYDYTHRLLDFGLNGSDRPPAAAAERAAGACGPVPRVVDLLEREGLAQADRPDDPARPVFDLTQEALSLPAERDQRLQNLARGDEGFLLGLAYSTQRGFGGAHPYVGELRMGEVEIEIEPAELGFPITVGEIALTECEMVNSFPGNAERAPQFSRGYGLAFGHNERKAMAMALVDRALRTAEYGEEPRHPAQDEEFVLYHSDNLQASGFVQHLKLPHYVDFQSDLQTLRRLRADPGAARPEAAE
jgi:alpha-D-ribose 1-methylphosphonate 5-triphosphate synthase subunit PhnI